MFRSTSHLEIFHTDLSYDLFRDVLHDATLRKYEFSVTIRDDTIYDNSVHQFINACMSKDSTVTRTGEWPGTKLKYGGATVVRGTLTADSLGVLLPVGGFFNFRGPTYPEDLAIYSHSEPVCFAVAHENFGYVDLQQFSSQIADRLQQHVQET